MPKILGWSFGSLAQLYSTWWFLWSNTHLVPLQYPAGVGNFWYGKPLSGLCLLQSYASHVAQDFM